MALGPAAGPAPAWAGAVAALAGVVDAAVVANRGWDLAWERQSWQDSASQGREHLSVRVHDDEVQIGPRWVPGTTAGCPGCAEARSRSAVGHPLASSPAVPRRRVGALAPVLPELLEAAARHLARAPLGPGELLAVGPAGTRRHRVHRSVHCALCGPVPGPATTPGPLRLVARPVAADDPTRGAVGTPVLDRAALHRDLVDDRFGPVRAVLRESRVPFAMSMAVLPEAPAMGHGRASTFAQTESVAVLEAYERLGGFPFDAPVLEDVPWSEVADRAVDPLTLGRLTGEQLAHPSCRVRPFDASTPMDWVWGHDLVTGRPLLVPADVGFYQYDYAFRRDRRAAREAGPGAQRRWFHESSSGCAVGSSFEEAALHALFEVAERDAFQLAWHAARPLPAIDPGSVPDGTTQALLRLVAARGFDVHLLVATQDVAVPVVWVLAVDREGRFPATFSSAGSGADPVGAVRGALREVAQLVTNPVDWTRAQAEAMHEDPWLVRELEDHVRVNSLPEALPRVTAALGGPRTTLAEAFPDWPGRVGRAARGDLRGSLALVRDLFVAAGLDRLVLVDQTSRDHADVGISVVKAVVPHSLPMCFGHAHQRLAGLPRLDRALAGTPQAARRPPYDPHPFP
ncbi:hypothetical protein D5H78_04665 [Vallicoccus soli]|uniref:YcaO domain-containing protein n=1 Tax=Vallicoccus soli TaxID=2339232 RepID=A0A3A3Z4Y3_9ACTN|nr:hypothetical protein D5H78_04665 [Vallicoccus soli]